MLTNPYSVRADKFYFREEELYVGLGHSHGMRPERRHPWQEEVLDNSRFRCKLTAHSVSNQFIRVPVSMGYLKQGLGYTARLPRGGEWLRNHVSIPIGSAVWSG
jgi:hypothetical protein